MSVILECIENGFFYSRLCLNNVFTGMLTVHSKAQGQAINSDLSTNKEFAKTKIVGKGIA